MTVTIGGWSEMCRHLSLSDKASSLAEAVCKYCVPPFKCSHLSYLNIWDSKSYCFHSDLVVTLCVGVPTGKNYSGSSQRPECALGKRWHLHYLSLDHYTPNSWGADSKSAPQFSKGTERHSVGCQARKENLKYEKKCILTLSELSSK